MDREILRLAEIAASSTPDPSRAMRNLERVLGAMDEAGAIMPDLKRAAHLFACSQFLANHCARIPGDLSWALGAMHQGVSRQRVLADAEGLLEGAATEAEAMDRLRLFKRRWLMVITLRDLADETDLVASMEELSFLAEAAIELALEHSIAATLRRHGPPPCGGRMMSVIALGKLGGVEINYSSDVDLMFVYNDMEGQTTGSETPSGMITNRISVHEYYIKVAEGTAAMLNKDTGEGIAYRVDLRLRPMGQKGELAMSLAAYNNYYENWGRTWERMALIRARPVAGDPDLGKAFLSVVERFVWHRPADYQEIEEIRALKKKIDSTFMRDDIKRGYGGIREAEFFIQTFQLIYGSDSRGLRSYRLMNAVQGLRRMGMVPSDELARLSDVYLYFRRLEHYLQMQDDLQTYRLPSGQEQTEVLARKMGFTNQVDFLSDLRLRRMSIKDMYNSLLGTGEDARTEALALLEDNFSDAELKGYVAFKGAVDTAVALQGIKGIREIMGQSQAPGERAIIRRGVPHLLDLALNETGPERALRGLESFLSSFGLKEAYLSALVDEGGLLPRGLIRIFASSSELTRLMLSGPEHLNWLVESLPIRKSLQRQMIETMRLLEGADDPASRLVKYKSVEWLRLGMLFLLGIIDIYDLSRFLSHLADTACATALRLAAPAGDGLCIIAMGKHGGRELVFGSDLDIVFASSGGAGATAMAARALKTLTSYSGVSSLYEVDTRLRPDGSKGELVKDMQGYRKYYMEKAHPWEVQALLKARPVAGDPAVAASFMRLAREVVIKRGAELTRELVIDMRGRIMRELARDSQEAFDIKLGPGGMEEIEFHVQWLQLQNLGTHPLLMVQHTTAAIARLMRAGILEQQDAVTLSTVYDYYKKLNTLLRLNSEKVATATSPVAHVAAAFMGHETPDEMMDCLRGHRETVLRLLG